MSRALAIGLALVAWVAASAPARAEEDQRFALGARVRGLWFTPAMLAPFAQTTSSLSTIDGGAEFIYRRKAYDVVTSLDLLFLNLPDGNFVGAGRDPSQDTHYVQFGNFGQLNFLSMDVSIVGHTALTRWLEVRYGAGVGLGLILGDVQVINNGRQCTAQNYADLHACYPHTPDGRVNIPLDAADAQAKLRATEKPGAIDLADDPHLHATNNKPPVMVVLNAQLGLRFRVQRHLAFDVDVGFRDGIFFGGAFHVLF
jgi:hypothetical protein